MGFRDNFRDAKEWSQSTSGQVNLNSPSDKACKYFDSVVSQLIGWYNGSSLGTSDEAVKHMLEEDSDFGALDTTRLNMQLKKRVQDLNLLVARHDHSKSRSVTDYERQHVRVVNLLADGKFKMATRELETITTRYPECVYSLKLIQDLYFYLGSSFAMRSSVSGALPQINSSNPFKGYVHGMYSFALEESNQYAPAQYQAKLALSIVPNDTWAIHNYAHCLLMQGLTDEGLKWMYEKKADWLPCSVLSCHQYWHTSLFHINKGEYDQAVEYLDQEILTRCLSSSSGLDLHDAASLIYRMELNDIFSKTTKLTEDPSIRWVGVRDMCKPYAKDHIVGFNDAHYMMSFLGSNDFELVDELITSMNDVPTLVERDNVVIPLLESMMFYKKQDYSSTIEKLFPIRHDIVKIGGSHAQRDVFEQLLLSASLKSEKPEHKKLAERLMFERRLSTNPAQSI
ncbi:Tetratricopeptide repeat protein 38, partial [Fragariocoptes setiger]